MALMKHPVGRLRILGILEGISYLLLLFIAMPLKYMADISEAVLITGATHGFLFILFVFAVINVFFSKKWTVRWAIGAVIASLLPFGTFVLDRQLRKHSAE
ncbi:DUF3817 domain-containing protein [Bacillus fonticola]|uniref:DUF3817 domain-containing protein n=1 Tax=Bacillus fonticola TaxID=2728853 RepID=UPI001475CAF4|nr:DUF3817 domain-containing protein [Bacillus fonticola]